MLKRGGGFGIAVEYEVAYRGCVESCWLGLVKKPFQRVDEPKRVIEMRKVASSIEQRKAAARHGFVCGLRMLDWDDPVVASPDDQ